MKNLVKLFGIIVIAAVTGFSFAACGGAGDQTGPGDGGLSVEIDPALAGTAWKDNEGGTSLTVSFTSSGMTWGGALGRSIEMATAVNEGLVTWFAKDGNISYITTAGGFPVPVKAGEYVKTGNTPKLTIGGVTYTMIPTIPDNENGNGGGDDPIESELWGLWVDKDIPEIFTIEFGKDTIIFGGTAGQNYKQYDALIDMGYTWRAGNGKIELVYKNIPQGVFTYTISGNELRLKASPVIVDVGVFVKQ